MVMHMPTGHYLVLTTCPHETAARSLAESVLGEQLAACVNIVPGLQSIYRWKGAIEEGRELLLLIKTTRECYPRLERHIRAHHPYELPEIVAVDFAAGFSDYLAWIGDSCQSV
jgi:periplasmic divalent cation tolerance protein